MKLEDILEEYSLAMFDRAIAELDDKECYVMLLNYVKKQLDKAPRVEGKKKLYYISAEFLIGKLLSNNLINLKIYHDVKEILEKNGKSLSAIEEVELEPSLGNGGLGRLAACFMDSITTLDCRQMGSDSTTTLAYFCKIRTQRAKGISESLAVGQQLAEQNRRDVRGAV